MASILVSGNAALQANSDRHFTASWNESMVDAKCFSNILAATDKKQNTLDKSILCFKVITGQTEKTHISICGHDDNKSIQIYQF